MPAHAQAAAKSQLDARKGTLLRQNLSNERERVNSKPCRKCCRNIRTRLRAGNSHVALGAIQIVREAAVRVLGREYVPEATLQSESNIRSRL
jgi:hypothetical protein